ncbi:MAG: DUF3373 domain-containing protein [Proteobacteria bacterium]|nr:DUF3373 domain-containing protein [Pseudomonadota bacterium]MBU1547600.1 DUF3373 domain-containing protein [Pseudomonadota bacterium]MBU2619215.1 DUF3373 domain-containing protein [Pseudomonadota bacterium]
MKKILLTAGALLAWTSCAVAGAGGQTVAIPVEDYKAILERLDTLQKRVDQMEKAESPSGKVTAAAMPSKLAKDVETIYDTLDKVETKTLKDRINLGAELRTRADFFKLKNDANFGGAGSVEHNDNHWTNRFRLNLDSEIRKNLLFTGRITAYKNFANSDNNRFTNDSNAAHLPGDSGLKLDRAYVDWIPEGMPIPLALTFGRHPSSEGPPSELKENRLRQSTYPSLLFDGEADGVVATVGLERYLGWKNSGIRFAWGKAYQDTNTAVSYMDNSGGMYDDTNIYAMFFETEIPGVRDSLLVLSALQASNLNGDPTYLYSTTNTAKVDIGDMTMYGIHAQANNLMDSGFDIFLSTGINKTDPSGQVITVAGSPGGAYDNTYGLMNTGANTDKHSGWAVHAGLRYNIPYKPWNNPKIGFEYNHGSEHWFSFTWGSAELFNKLAVRGDVYDFYYIQPFNDNLFGRLGYTHADYSHGMSGMHMGTPGDSSSELDNLYFLLDVRF